MVDRTEYVQKWSWVDYDRPGWSAYQVLVSDETGQIISNSMAVAMTLTLPRLLRFVKLFFPKEEKPERQNGGTGNAGSPEATADRELESVEDRTTHRVATSSRHAVEAESGEEHVERSMEDELDHTLPPALPPPQPVFFRIPHFSTRIGIGLINTLLHADSAEGAAAQLAIDHLAMGFIASEEANQTKNGVLEKCLNIIRNIKDDTWSFALISALIFMLFGIFVGEQVVAISMAGIVSGSIGLSKSPYCGNYISNNYNQAEIYLFQSRVLAAAQRRATSYVDSCYEAAILENCNIYYNKTISYSEEHNSSCPFFGNVCLYGETSAYTLDTDFIDSNVLGINAPQRYQFRRRTTCSPLVTNSSYIRYWNAVDNPNLSQMATYEYGNNETSLFTITQPVDFSWGHPEYAHGNGYYHFRTHGTSLYGAFENRNILRAEFLPPASDVSLLFIMPKFVQYSNRSDDPIFPADLLADDQLNYFNSLPHATVLGCVDTAEIRHPQTLQIWTPRNFTEWRTPSSEWQEDPMKNLFLLLGLALDHSNTWSAINYGVSLDAERRIIYPGGTSLPLAREQWKVESRRFFDISLALIQGKIYDIARGSGFDVKGVRNTFEDVNRPICSVIKIQTNGWTNISLFWLVTLPTFSFLIWFTSIKVSGKLVLVWFYLKSLEPWLSPIFQRILKPVLLGSIRLIGHVPGFLLFLIKNTIYPNGLGWIIRQMMAKYHSSRDRRRRVRIQSEEDSTELETPG